MRKQHRTQLAFVVLLIVTAFPHQYQTQEDSDINDDDTHHGNNNNNTTTTNAYKHLDGQTQNISRKTTLAHTNYDILTDEKSAVNKTTDGKNSNSSTESLTSSSANKKKSESERRSNEEGIGMGSGKKPALSNANHHRSITSNHYERPHKISSRNDDVSARTLEKITSEAETVKVSRSDSYTRLNKLNTGKETAAGKRENANAENRKLDGPEQREIDDAVEYGLERMRDLYFVKEPELYKMGLFLEKSHPAFLLATFRTPNEKTLNYARYGYAALQARTKLAELYPDNLGRESPATVATFRSGLLQEECPLQGFPRCPPGFERYRTADGTCNNFRNPWRGASMLPMQRFLPPHYDDGIQKIRRSVSGEKLPSPRDISIRIHRNKNRETPTVTLMFMQWGQFLDHDITSSAQARMFNRSVPRCCQEGGVGLLPPELTHPECLPIPVSDNDWFLRQFGIRCIEFVRSAPTSRIDCDLGWREQISQVTAYIDGSAVYGSDSDTADSLRLFRRGQLVYGRSQTEGPLQPPDPPEGELCRLGALTTDCFRGGDLRVGDQPGLTALHTVWLRYHNRLAVRLANLNPHWSDEKLYQEARRIVGAFIQHITYREFLPIVLGQEVMKLFELDLERSGYYEGYNARVNPAPANSFGTAAFRFGHSLVQGSFVRTDTAHRIIRNNVTLHEEQENVENIWSFGSVDRLLLGLCNQPTQRRDEFISDELTNHLFQSPGFPFGMDLAAINIQRGRDHGVPSYTAWREPCGLVPLRNWTDLERIMSAETVQRFRSLYVHFDDIDLFSGGLAEKPVRGGIVGPTFACIIAQQFSNLRKGDRFWYENGNFESSFTPAQLQQIRRVTFAHVLCKTMKEIETLQPFVFLSADGFRNTRVACDDPIIDSFDLTPWEEKTRPLRFDNLLRKSDEINVDLAKTTTATPESYDELSFEDYNDADEIEESEGVKSRARPNKKRRKTKLTTPKRKILPTKSTVTRVTRPAAYINNQAVGQTRPFKVKLTNVATVNLSTKNKYGRPANNAQKRPVHGYDRTTVRSSTNKRPFHQTDGYHQGNFYQPTRRPVPIETPSVDGYLIDFSEPGSSSNNPRPKPTKPQSDGAGPYHVNINIQFVPPDEQAQNSDRFETYTYNSNKLETTTRRTKPPSYTKKPPTRRPVLTLDSYGQNQQDYTKRPNSFATYNNFATKRPSYTYKRPQNEYSDFQYTPEPTSLRPLYRPPTNHETVFEDIPFATSNKPYNSYNTFSHRIPTMKPVIIPSYLYLNENEQDNYQNDDLYQQTPRPTHNRRPTTAYKTEDDHDTVEDETQNAYSHVLISDPNFDPDQHFFTAEYKQELDKTDVIHYSLDENSTNTSDMDFEHTLPYKLEHDDENTFIKISSTRGHKITTVEEMKNPIYVSVQQREGDLELSNNNEHSDESPLIQVDIIPSEIRTNEWKIYSEIDGITPALPMFDIIDFNLNVSCASEIPKPINFNENNITATS